MPTAKPAPDPEVESPQIDSEAAEDSSEEFVVEEAAPSAEEMAAYLGATGSSESKFENDDKSLPTLEEVEAMVPAKTKALMDELFRARLEKVKRINPKEIL